MKMLKAKKVNSARFTGFAFISWFCCLFTKSTQVHVLMFQKLFSFKRGCYDFFLLYIVTDVSVVVCNLSTNLMLFLAKK